MYDAINLSDTILHSDFANLNCKGPKASGVCQSKVCQSYAKSVLSTMDLSVDPCDNFYKFTCGKFLKQRRIPHGSGKLEMLTPMNRKLMKQGRMLVDEHFRNFVGRDFKSKDWQVFQLARDHFMACKREETRSNIGNKPLTKLLETLVGGWPILKADDNRAYMPWYEMEMNIANSGLIGGHILSLGIVIDHRTADRHILKITPAKHGISSRTLLEGPGKNKLVKAYFEKMLATVALFGVEDVDFAKKEMKAVLNFEVKLAQMELEIMKKLRQDHLIEKEHPMTLSQLPTNDGLPKDWVQFIKVLLLNQIEVSPDFEIVVVRPQFLEAVAKLMSRMSPRVVMNYFCWRIVDIMLPHLDIEARKIVSGFNFHTKGKVGMAPIWHVCTHMLGFNNYHSHSIGVASAAMFIQKFVDHKEKKVMKEIISTIKDSFSEDIVQADWMDDFTTKFALKKLKHIQENVVYPDELNNQTVVENYLKGLNISRNNYFQNVLNIQRFDDLKSVAKLLHDPDHFSWSKSSSVIVVNAFYKPKSNQISFPAAFLQGSMFNSRLPLYMNFGGVGAIVGHEITHGFDDNGRKYDHLGRKKNWWDPATLGNYLNRTICMQEQYSKYVVEKVKMKVNGKLTLGENIADNGGMKIDILGYELALKRKPREELFLPGLEGFSNFQMLWINHGHTFCSKMRPKMLERKLKTSVHSPMEFRVNGVAQNSKHFGRDFNCPLGSAMNPHHKCILW